MSSTPIPPEGGSRPPESDAGTPQTGAASVSLLRSRQTRWLLLAAVIAGGAGTFIADRCYGLIPRPEMSAKYYKESEERWATLDFSPDVMAEMKLKDSIQLARNSALALGIIGALLGGLLGSATGLERKAGRGAIVGLSAGVIAGGLCGALAGHVGVWVLNFLEGYQVQVEQPGDLAGAWLRKMYSTVAVHAGEWAIVAIGVGLAAGLAAESGKRPIGRTIAFSVGAGLLASALYTPLAAWLFPGLESELPFPEGTWNRLLFVMLPSVAMALMIAASGRKAHSPSQAATASAN